MIVTNPSSGPRSASVREIAPTSASSSVTSTTTEIARPPPAATAFATRSARSASRSATATSAPAAARSIEVLSPMPCPPPSTRTRLPSSPNCGATTASVLQLDDELVVGLRTDVLGGLDATSLHVHHRTRRDVGFEVLGELAAGVGLLLGGDPVAVEDHQDVVELVLVDVAVGAGRQRQLPDA